MGEIADSLINGEFDAQTGEYIGEPCGYPRTLEPGYYNSVHTKDTLAEANIRAVRKELALLIKAKIEANPLINKNVLVNDARAEINKKYGKGWRERGLISNWKPLNEY